MTLSEWVKDIIGTREDTDALVNNGVEIVVGGAGETKPKKIVLREPAIARFDKHVHIIARGLNRALEDIKGDALLRKAVPDGSALGASLGDLVRSEGIRGALCELVADLVEETPDYVNGEMTPRQVGKVLKTYGMLVGWETIERFFVLALTKGADYAEKILSSETTT